MTCPGSGNRPLDYVALDTIGLVRVQCPACQDWHYGTHSQRTPGHPWRGVRSVVLETPEWSDIVSMADLPIGNMIMQAEAWEAEGIDWTISYI